MQDAETCRFLIKSVQNGVIEVAWSKERDHHPVAVGTVQLRSGIAPADDDPVTLGAHACVMDWQRATGKTL